MKRLVFAYLIGWATCVITIFIANRPNLNHFSFLYFGLLGLSSGAADLRTQRMSPAHLVFAVALISMLFILAEALRSRGSWLRWLGYGLWALLAAAALFWFTPPNI
jgi:hypothetical protein